MNDVSKICSTSERTLFWGYIPDTHIGTGPEKNGLQNVTSVPLLGLCTLISNKYFRHLEK